MKKKSTEMVIISNEKMERRFIFFDEREASLFPEEDII